MGPFAPAGKELKVPLDEVTAAQIDRSALQGEFLETIARVVEASLVE
ncbi:MAG: hypothetical protein V3U39_09030 [Acidimicrobiia bacterium]